MSYPRERMQGVSEQSGRENGNGGGPYRAGRHQDRNLYRGEEYLGVMFDPVDTAAIVNRMNRHAASGSVWPEKIVDGDGDDWLRGGDGLYRMGHGEQGVSLSEVVLRYGLISDGGDGFRVSPDEHRVLDKGDECAGVLFDPEDTAFITYVMNLPEVSGE